jgi:superfamily II DNA or RNA helicase
MTSNRSTHERASGARTLNDAPFQPIGTATASLAEFAAELSARHGGRDYQRALSADIVRALETPVGVSVLGKTGLASSVIACVPTAGGKSHIALSVAALLQREAGLRVGWIAAKRELLRQARAEIEKFGFELDLRTISMFDSDPPQVDLVVFDEAHRDACTTAASLVARIRPTYAIGLTATPWRGDGARLAYGHELHRCTIQQLQDDGYLAQYSHVAIEDWKPETVARTWLADQERFGASIAFFRTGAEARACLDVLRRQDVRADLVHGGSDRESQLEAFAAGELDVLVAMGCLSEGYSAPWLRTVFARPASRGPLIQMCGRALRPDPEVETKYIVQARMAPTPFTRIARPLEQFMLRDGDWRALGATRDIDAIVARMRGMVARARADIPAFIAKSRGRVGPSAARAFRSNGNLNNNPIL